MDDPRDEYPRWDERHASTIVGNDDVSVGIDTVISADGETVDIRRTETKRAYRRNDQHILWTGTIATLSRREVLSLMGDLMVDLATR